MCCRPLRGHEAAAAAASAAAVVAVATHADVGRIGGRCHGCRKEGGGPQASVPSLLPKKRVSVMVSRSLCPNKKQRNSWF